jgi:hypothetical protein
MKKPSGAEFLLRLLRHLPVAGKTLGPFTSMMPISPSGRTLPLSASTMRKLHARQREADGARAPFAVIGVGGVHVGLGHAVALENAVAGALRSNSYVGFGQQWRAAGHEQPHVPDEFPGEAGSSSSRV